MLHHVVAKTRRRDYYPTYRYLLVHEKHKNAKLRQVKYHEKSRAYISSVMPREHWNPEIPVTWHARKAAEVGEQDAFDGLDTQKYLCRMNGGHARNLLIIIRSACTTAGGLPLTRHVVERAILKAALKPKRA